MKTSHIFAALLVTCAMACPGFATTTITWTPPSISVTVSSGTLKTFSFSFVSSETLHAIDVVIVPALRPYVTVTPSHFDQITSGLTYYVQLFMSVPDGNRPIGNEGTIQLRPSLHPRGYSIVRYPFHWQAMKRHRLLYRRT